jgi:hypothetical protein
MQTILGGTVKIWIFYIFLLLVSCASPNKERTSQFNFEVVNFGIYTTKTTEKEYLESSPTKLMSRSGVRNHIKTTTKVPPKLNTRFGMEYIVHSKKSDSVKLKFKWIPSVPVKTKSEEVYSEISYEKIKRTNKIQYAGYIISIQSELEQDSWTLQIFAGDVLLQEKTYYIYD